MSADALLDAAFTTLLGKAQREGDDATPIAKGATLNFEWAGAGAAVVASAADPILLEVPFPADIVWVHLYAGNNLGQPVAVTCTLDLQLTQWATFGGSTSLYGDGLSPRITADALANMDLTGWHTQLAAGDTLIARLLTFSGAARFVTMNIMLRPSLVLQGASDVTSGGDAVTDSSGNPVVFRS